MADKEPEDNDDFDLSFEELPAGEGTGLWPQPRHAEIAAKRQFVDATKRSLGSSTAS